MIYESGNAVGINATDTGKSILFGKKKNKSKNLVSFTDIANVCKRVPHVMKSSRDINKSKNHSNL